MVKTGVSSQAFEQAIALKMAAGRETVPNKARKWPRKSFERVTFLWMGHYCPGLERKVGAEFQHLDEVLIRMVGYEFRLTKIRTQSSINSGRK